MADLVSEWRALARALGLADELAGDIYATIARRHGEPHRHYHSLNHLSDLVSKLHSDAAGLVQDVPAVLLAIFFHDIVYDPASSRNEEDSADLFASILGRHLAVDLINKVSSFILATKSHSPVCSDCNIISDMQLFLDLDMSILGAPPVQYVVYADQIRQEYSIYSDQDYRDGRAKALQSMCQASRPIFSSTFLGELYEQQARANITAELARLAVGEPL